MEVVTEWVRSMFVIILALTFIEVLVPAGAMAKFLRFFFSLVILAAILAPLATFLE